MLKKVIEILKTFDKEELKKFERFIRSGYFNTNESITKIFKYLKKFYPAFDSPLITQEKLFQHIYGTRKFDDKTFRYLITELLELTEKFLVVSAYETRPVDERKTLIEELLNKKLFSQANKHLKFLEKMFDESPFFSVDKVSNQKDIAILWNELSVSLDRQEPLTDKRLEQAESLIFYSIIELASMYNILLSLRRVYNIDFDDRIVTSFVNNLDYKSYLENLDKIDTHHLNSKSKLTTLNAFKAYLCFMITILDIKDEYYFYRMKDIVNNSGSSFSKEELYNLYAMLDACCHLKRDAIDDIKYLKEHFDIEKISLARGLFKHSEEQYMQVGGFISLINTAIMLKETAWAEKFAEHHLEKISPELKDDVYNYSMAQINFEKGEFENSLEKLNKVKYKFVLFKQFVRNLMLKNYYELNYFEEAFSLIDSYTHFLSDNKRIYPQSKQKNLNFINYTKELLKFKADGKNTKQISLLKNEVHTCKLINNKSWLLEKIKELS